MITFDVERHFDVKLTGRMLRALEAHPPAIALAAGRPEADVRAAHAVLEASRLPIDYRAPADAASSRLPAGSVDIVFSNSVLEHVPRPDVARLMHESARVLRPGGLSMHQRTL